jgi:hypothetical protein
MRRSIAVFGTRTFSPARTNYPAAWYATTHAGPAASSKDKHATSATARAGTQKTQKVEDPKTDMTWSPMNEKAQQKELKKAADRKRDVNMRPQDEGKKDEVVHVASPAAEAGSQDALMNEDLAAEADWRRLATEPEEEAGFTHEKDNSHLKKADLKDSDSSAGM